MDNKESEMQEWGSFALVAYIPDPLGSFLNSLRQILPGEENPQAHITLLPPRPLKSPVEAASLQAQKILAKFQPFSVQLAEVCTFPETNVVYLEISDGSAKLHELHNALNCGDLAHDEDFEFKPHLTLSGPVGLREVGQVRTEAAAVWRSSDTCPTLEIREAVALWQPAKGSQNDWQRLWSHELGQPHPNRQSAAKATRTS
jgi:2'-5' RNA ligase